MVAVRIEGNGMAARTGSDRTRGIFMACSGSKMRCFGSAAAERAVDILPGDFF
jgi:hypothetical protein